MNKKERRPSKKNSMKENSKYPYKKTRKKENETKRRKIQPNT